MVREKTRKQEHTDGNEDRKRKWSKRNILREIEREMKSALKNE